ncbi:hypothetical protein [Streptomyces sp. NPDC096132]|uniref:hypothetical protein n=1 Tax=Streptomyces sp. NPDC096132 TaxID=3366075 RepID=UPI00380FE61E
MGTTTSSPPHTAMAETVESAYISFYLCRVRGCDERRGAGLPADVGEVIAGGADEVFPVRQLA